MAWPCKGKERVKPHSLNATAEFDAREWKGVRAVYAHGKKGKWRELKGGGVFALALPRLLNDYPNGRIRARLRECSKGFHLL